MKVYLAAILLALSVTQILSADTFCSDTFVAKPCSCQPSPINHKYNLYCTGESVGTSTLADFKVASKDSLFHILYISDTNATAIRYNSFVNKAFESIFIENNQLLDTIDRDAFNNDNHTLINLVIRNNPKLDSDSIFGVTRYLLPTEVIELEGNGLSRIPANAFGDNKRVQRVYLHDNQIREIHDSSPFQSLCNLTQLSLANNNMSVMHGLRFCETDQSRELLIYLNDNGLNEDSFKEPWIAPKNITLKVNFRENRLTTIPEKWFRPLVETDQTTNELYFYNNDFVCGDGRRMKWMLEFEANFFEIYCADLERHFFDAFQVKRDY